MSDRTPDLAALNDIMRWQDAVPQPMHLPLLRDKNIRLDVLRLDRLHPILSGNKWFKLKYYLQDAVQLGKKISTFGGPFSNHLLATAFAAACRKVPSIGFVRGRDSSFLSHSLQRARELGMTLVFLPRSEYLKRNDADFIRQIDQENPDTLLIPEGGAGILGVRGSREILQLVRPNEYTHIICAVGTATTLLGLADAMGANQRLLGVAVLKGMDSLPEEKISWLENPRNIKRCIVNNEYHFGGYAKRNAGLFEFMNRFYAQTGIPTDFVYTAKMFFAVVDLAQKDFFSAGSKLLAIHSGGLQGNDSLPKGTLIFI